jgi:diguanylate cyclase (GGDEF)-like protein/PAS domain S-box-containing protein
MEKVACWEVFRCGKKECPVYRAKASKCWLIEGTLCRDEIQGKFFEKMHMCLGCKVFKKNIDISSMRETCGSVDKQFREYRKIIRDRDRELEDMSLELALGLSEVFEALKKISSGDPTVRIPEKSKVELISKLKHMVNMTAENIGEIVDQAHEIAIDLAEHFDVLHRVSKGDLNSRVSGRSKIELLQSLSHVTNEMIGNISSGMEEREKAEKWYRTVFENTGTATVIIEADMVISLANTEFEKLSGYSREEIEGEKTWTEFVVKEDLGRLREYHRLRRIDPDAAPRHYEFGFMDRNGRVHEVFVSIAVIPGTKKSVASLSDITEKKFAEKALREKEEREALILGSLPMAFYTVDPDALFAWKWVSNQIDRITGFHPEEYLHNHSLWVSRIHPEDYEQVVERFNAITEKGAIVTEYRWKCAEGSYSWFRDHAVLIRDEEGSPREIVGAMVDITDRKRAEEALRTLSLADELTDLYNRRGFFTIAEQQLKIAKRMEKRMMLLFADLDGLKWINDNLGHQEGDMALIDVANILKKTFRESDFIARIGGDEFVVLGIEAEEPDAGMLANRLLENVKSHNEKRMRSYSLSISTGIAHYDPDNPCSIDELLAGADKLMYEQKQKKHAVLLNGLREIN